MKIEHGHKAILEPNEVHGWMLVWGQFIQVTLTSEPGEPGIIPRWFFLTKPDDQMVNEVLTPYARVNAFFNYVDGEPAGMMGLREEIALAASIRALNGRPSRLLEVFAQHIAEKATKYAPLIECFTKCSGNDVTEKINYRRPILKVVSAYLAQERAVAALSCGEEDEARSKTEYVISNLKSACWWAAWSAESEGDRKDWLAEREAQANDIIRLFKGEDLITGE